MEATNWQGEQALRPAVVNRKVWGGNRTWVGAGAQAVLMSVLVTCHRARLSALDFVSQTLRAFGNPAFQRPILLSPRQSTTIKMGGVSAAATGSASSRPVQAT